MMRSEVPHRAADEVDRLAVAADDADARARPFPVCARRSSTSNGMSYTSTTRKMSTTMPAVT